MYIMLNSWGQQSPIHRWGLRESLPERSTRTGIDQRTTFIQGDLQVGTAG